MWEILLEILSVALFTVVAVKAIDDLADIKDEDEEKEI